ncbi:MAG: DNA topoisomerase I [Candidatus Micrarchaeota archaeon]
MATILVITEKPRVAEKLAAALCKSARQKSAGAGVSYYELERGKDRVLVAPVVGHVYTLAQKEKTSGYPVFDIEWVESSKEGSSSAYTKKYLDSIKKLAKSADEAVNACDYDTEGSVIGGNVIRFACKGIPAKRMLFSSLTEDELQSAFDSRGELDQLSIDAGEARHTLDWFWGINASRALMSALRAAGKFKVMSIGRVQGPSLAILARREKEIAAFVGVPYWQLAAYAKGTEFIHEKERFFDEAESKLVFEESKACKTGEISSVDVRQFKQPPGPPFDLTTLQVEAYKNFGFTPSRTLELAQSLYEQALITYPRTSSQKLPEKLNLQKVIRQIAAQAPYSVLANELVSAKRFVPKEGAKEDSAHVAVYPTGQKPAKLSPEDENLYDLIVRRFLSCFAPDATRESMKVRMALAGKHAYVAEGTRTLEKGWFVFYGPYVHLEEIQLPPFSHGETVKIEKVERREKMTQPPKRFTPASIVRELERENLGTKSTRSAIIDTLYSRSYLSDKKSIKVTSFGLSVYDALAKNVPEIMDEKLTRQFEEEMDSIVEGKYGKQQVISEGKSALSKILEGFKLKEEVVGKALAAGLTTFQRHEDVLGKCDKCAEGKIVIKKSKFGYFAACNKYPACKNTFPLPRMAKVVPKNSQCPQCNTPQVRVFRKGRKPFEMCLLPACPSKAGWAKKEPQQEAQGTGNAEKASLPNAAIAVKPPVAIKPSAESNSAAAKPPLASAAPSAKPVKARKPAAIKKPAVKKRAAGKPPQAPS